MTFAGTAERAEARLVPDAGFELDTFRISGLPRRPGRRLAAALVAAARAPLACRRIIARRRPDVVLGGGGYVAGPMVVAAASARVPAALTEADAHLGLANRLAAPLARRVFLAFPLEGRHEGAKYRVTGRPVRRLELPPKEEARRRFSLPVDGPALLVFGGSQGARALNEFAVDAFGARGPAVLHLCGQRYQDELRPRVSRPEYRLLAFADDIGAALAACDLALARAGGSVWELAAAGLPAVLVPSPNVTADHQTKNARYFAARGGAVMLPESRLADGGAEAVTALLGDDARLRPMRAAMGTLARPNAADDIAKELIALARTA